MHIVRNYMRSLKNVDQMRIRKPSTNIMYINMYIYLYMCVCMKIPRVLLLHH